jgi:serine/threonine protein kinase
MTTVMERYGATSCVEILNNATVNKIIDADEFYWVREYFIWKWLSLTTAYHPQYSEDIQFKKIKNKDMAVISMPYHGQCLSTRSLQTDASFLQIFIDVMRHIKNIHAVGIIHRDIKPENIMILNSRATLIDFGHARLQCKKTPLTTQVYTYLYRPPEVYKGNNYTESADIWAAGVTFASCLLNKPLYAALPIHENRAAHMIHTGKVLFTEDDVSRYFNSKRDIQTDIYAVLSEHRKYRHRPSTEMFTCWISAMLNLCPEKRPTAAVLEEYATQLAVQLGINISPERVHLPANHAAASETTDGVHEYDQARYEQLLIQAKNEMSFVSRQICPNLNTAACSAVLKRLIDQNHITEKNYRTMTCAAVLILCNIVYDQFLSIQYTAKSCVGVKRSHLAAAIYTLLKSDIFSVIASYIE